MKTKGPSEHKIQSDIVGWFRNNYPDRWLYANANGGARDMITGARLKAEGVTPGVVDLTLLWRIGNCPGLQMEVKKPDKKLSDDQYKFLVFCYEQGWATAVVYDHMQGIETILDYFGFGIQHGHPLVCSRLNIMDWME